MPNARTPRDADPAAGLRRTVLIVEDDAALRSSLERYLRRSSQVRVARNCADAFAVLDDTDALDLLLIDITLPDGQGFEVGDRAALRTPRPGVIMMTGDSRVDNAITALQHGASDFLLKPFSLEALDAAMARVEVHRQPAAPPRAPEHEPLSAEAWRQRFAPSLIGQHPRLLEVLRVLARVAHTDVSVLITGESGTGKELVARALHAAGGRSGRLVTVNCAAIPAPLLESELFGHEKGAFTGASDRRLGRFAAADGGTIFLDEIGELPLPLQAKILRVLQEKRITPVGTSSSQTVDVRVVAATNRDLERMTAAGAFREDLFYRLNVVPVALPPLRERRTDIPSLVRHFIGRVNERRNRQITGISEDAVDRLVAHDWPGNVRELENVLERMMVLCGSQRLEWEDLPAKHQQTAPLELGPQMFQLPADGIDLQRAVEAFETSLMLQAVERTSWNKKRAAALLHMNRTTLVERLKKKKMATAEDARNTVRSARSENAPPPSGHKPR